MDHLCILCLVFVILSCLFIAALWSPEGKGLTAWLFFVMFNCDLVTFPLGMLGQVWYLIVSIPNPCCLSNSLRDVTQFKEHHCWGVCRKPGFPV